MSRKSKPGIERSSDFAYYSQEFYGIQDGPFVCFARFLILHMYNVHFIHAAVSEPVYIYTYMYIMLLSHDRIFDDISGESGSK